MMAVKDGDLEKAKSLFEAYHKRIYNYLVKMTLDRELGHDLTQNVFLRLIKYRHSYKKGMPFQAWIFQIARNVQADHFNKNKLRYSDYTDLESIAGFTTEDEAQDEQQNQESMLHKAMGRLNHEDRELLVMSRFMKMKYEEIATATGLSLANVKVKAHRAIKKLRDHYFELEKM